MDAEETPNIEYFTAEIERMGVELNLDVSTRQFALTMFERIVEAEIRYTSMNRIATVCLYITCRLQDQPVTLSGIAEVSRVGQKEIHTVSSRVSNELGLGIGLTDPDVLLESYCEELPLGADDTEQVFEVSEAAKAANEHINTVPSTFAASVLYAASEVFDFGINQKEIAAIGDTSTVTIRKNYRSIVEAVVEYSGDTNVPPSAYPVRSVEEAFNRLEEAFPDRDADIEQARSVLETHDSLLESGKNEGAITAAAFRIVVDGQPDAPSTKEVTDIVGVSTQTVHNRMTDINNAGQSDSVG